MSGGGTQRVGFIGLGSQGGPMARRIIEAGFPVTLWARRPESLEPFAATPAQPAASAAALGAQVDLACVCVRDDAGVDEVVAGDGGLLDGMAAGTAIAVHSTVHPDTCTRLATLAARRGVGLIDAPVSGGAPQAEAGKLLVMAGGPADLVERVRPVFETYGSPVVHLGEVGAGQRAKLVNNLLFTATLAVAESGFALGAQLGIDPGQLAVVLAHGSGASFGAGVLAQFGFSLAAMRPFMGELLRKDVRIVASLAGAAEASPGPALAAADVALDSLGCPR
jgi:3-hydroxyisobutyrate dehydrogenase-like beta-hydroxyacid dehydrogenase